MNPASHKKAMKKYYQKRILTARGKAQQTKRHMQANSKKRGHTWSDDWWTLDMIEDIITNGKCAVTGLSFSVGGLTGTGNRNPFNASPDRIDNTKGYEPSNVQWVVFIYNLMKSNFKDEDVVLFIKKLQQTSM
jgi:hypothetical protein